MQINLFEAKAHLGRYVKEVQKGETFIVCERNKPVAELRPIQDQESPKVLVPGLGKGMFSLPDSFNDPLPEFEKDFYAGSSGESK